MLLKCFTDIINLFNLRTARSVYYNILYSLKLCPNRIPFLDRLHPEPTNTQFQLICITHNKMERAGSNNDNINAKVTLKKDVTYFSKRHHFRCTLLSGGVFIPILPQLSLVFTQWGNI